MSDTYRMEVQAGEPYYATLTLAGGGIAELLTVWTDEADFEVRAQVRSGKGENYPVRFDLSDYLDWSIVADTIVVTVSLTGAQTREAGSGYYDMFVTDPGVTDLRGRKVLEGRFDVEPAITAAS